MGFIFNGNIPLFELAYLLIHLADHFIASAHPLLPLLQAYLKGLIPLAPACDLAVMLGLADPDLILQAQDLHC